MKNYKDISERVFRKGDAILEKKHRRTVIIKKTSFAVSGLCAVIITGFGLWNNYSLKNAMKNEYPVVIDSPEIPENDIPVMVQTSVSTTTQSAVSTAVQTSASTTAPTSISTTVQTSASTTAPTSISTTASTSISTTVQTSVSTAVQTSVSTTAQTSESTTVQTSENTTTQTYIVTDTTNPPQNIDDERSLNMKKLTSIISALTVAFSAMPTISNASGVPFSVNPDRFWAGEKKAFAKMESGELDVDINGNGEFDIMDCYLLDSYASEYYSYKEKIDPEIIQRIESIADYNNDRTVDFDDTIRLMRYFIASGNVRSEYLDPAYYAPDIEPLTTMDDIINFGKYKEIQEYVFPMRMYYNVNYLNAEYYLVEDMYETGKIDLDINGNGQLDIFDAYCLHVYFMEHRDHDAVTQYITEEEYQKCFDFTYRYSEPLVPHHYGVFTETSALSYILNHIELKPEYFTIAFYKENVDNYSIDHCIAPAMRRAAKHIGIEVSDNIGPAIDIEYSRKHFLDMDVFNPYYDEFCADIENGVRSVPDVNHDGVVDYYDFFDMSIYWSDMDNGTAERSILPEKTWNTINEWYGIPDDDKPTLYEITSAQFYIMERNEEPENIDDVYNAYIEKLIEAKANNYESLNEDIQILDVDAERSGDANEDGEVSLADAVLIMQALSNPDEFQLTKKGQYNADVYNTGDGVTVNDALQIQIQSINA